MKFLDRTRILRLLMVFGLSLLTLTGVYAAPAAPDVRQTFLQADGSEVTLRLWGDEYVHGWESTDGFTVLHNSATGMWEYAVQDSDGRLTSSGFSLGSGPAPASAHLRPSAAVQNDLRSAAGASALGVPSSNVPPPFGIGNTKVLFIMVEFSDEACSYTDAQMQNNLFGGGATGPGDLDDYFREISYGKLNMVGTVAGGGACYTLPNTKDYYDEEDMDRDEELIKDAVDLADIDVDFSQFDNDGDGKVDVIGIIFAGGAAHDGCDADADGDLWPHSSGLGSDYATSDGVDVNRFIIQSEITYGISDFVCDEMQTIGLFAHEFGHSLGIPDLYDTDDSSPGINKWSAMASQYISTVNLSDTPPHYDAWSKSYEGWTTPADMTGFSGEVVLGQASDTDDVIRLLDNPDGVEIGGSGEYFLLENRQNSGFDIGLSGCGILIWHIDEARTNNKLEGHDAVNHRLVDLEQADGLAELDMDGKSSDAGDPFPGSTNNQLWDEGSNPHSLLYSGNPADTTVRAANFSECQAAMTFNIGDPRADVSISKTDSPDPVIAGEYLTYHFLVRNFGPGVATGVTVTDVLPEGVAYQTDTDSCVEAPAGTLTCSLGDIPVGDSKQFDMLVKVDSDLAALNDGPTSLFNEASVEAEQPDDDPSNNTDMASTLVLESADLVVSKQCKPDTSAVPAGGNGTCFIYIDNAGPSAARSVTLIDSIDSDGVFDLVSASVSSTGTNANLDNLGTCSPASQNNVDQHIDVTCNGFDLDAGDRATVTIVVSADAAGDINDIATASSDTPDPNIGNNQASGALSFAASADLSLSKSDAPDPVIAGTELVYTMTVTNNGPSTASSVVVRDWLPAGVSVVSIVPAASCNAGEPGDALSPTVCDFGNLASSGEVEMTVTVLVFPDTTGLLHNDASVVSGTADPDTSNNNVTVSTLVNAESDLVITKLDVPDPVLAGAELQYSVSVVNNGPSTATMVDIVDTLPAGVSFIDAQVTEGTANCSEAANTVTCTGGDLDPGEMLTVVIDVLVHASVPHGTTLTNTASVLEEGVEADAISIDTLVNAEADLWVDKTGNFPTGNPSGTILYYIAVHNIAGCSVDDPQVCGVGGPSDAQNVLVVDTLPSTAKKLVVQFVSEECSYNKGAHEVTCSIDTLLAGESVGFEIQVTAKGSIGEITNVVDLTSDTLDPNPGNNQDELLMVVQGSTGDSGGPGGGRGKGPKK
ncbi:M6 family metalloprotease domain-containing protein [Marinobacterium rhizophilum]|uniref:M6 family metalloprotease domain-containing protein n=1 Tax=Marinobacterium rhizophilum TaxID=420402 RepID=A0ABY5HHR9_9GAMM|nr:M6 family metalloprotease domain-containing protein [Marinobacterium rhizophilum]UTW11519.1 M6 family metalloprotease domain-containing protein [Marinobacterium rhizophilum]